MDNQLNVLARKAGFNSALRHFKVVTEYVGRVSKGANLADILNEYLDSGRVSRHQVKPIVTALLVDKFDYVYKSHNLGRIVDDVSAITETVSKWSKLDIVCVFHHPHTGVFVINPKRDDHWEGALPLGKDELFVVYVGAARGEEVKPGVLREAADDFASLMDGARVRGKKAYVSERRSAIESQPATPPRPSAAPSAEKSSTATESVSAAPAQAAPSVPKRRARMTARIPVLVSNELFHNGNVEAWKKIIESYKGKYDGLDVLIWYENERINDINALFKWGKVKHGTPIMISVVGDDPKDVSKLRRYLYEGASPRFEAFLHGGADRTLELF